MACHGHFLIHAIACQTQGHGRRCGTGIGSDRSAMHGLRAAMLKASSMLARLLTLKQMPWRTHLLAARVAAQGDNAAAPACMHAPALAMTQPPVTMQMAVHRIAAKRACMRPVKHSAPQHQGTAVCPWQQQAKAAGAHLHLCASLTHGDVAVAVRSAASVLAASQLQRPHRMARQQRASVRRLQANAVLITAPRTSTLVQ